jgi:MFS family permease
MQVITRELSGTSLDGFWANLTFLLAVVVTQPLYVSASDVIGRKPLLNAAFLLFALGSIVFATSRSMPVVIVGRAIQGLGGGGLDVLNEVLGVCSSYPCHYLALVLSLPDEFHRLTWSYSECQ